MSTPLTTPTWGLDGWAGNVLDDAGVAWVVEEVDGWDDSPPVRLEATEREQDDGAYDADTFYGARLLTLTGRADAPDKATMQAAKRRLAQVCADLRAGLKALSCDEADRTRYAYVRRAADVKVKDQGARMFSWQLQLLAPDPRKYGAAATVATGLANVAGGGATFPMAMPLIFAGAAGATGAIVVTNAGAYASRPTFRILGPVTDPVLENLTTGQRLRFAGLSLGAGDYLDVDTDARSAVLNGSASRRGTVASDSEWWSLAPGDNQVRFLAAAYTAAAQLQVTYRPAWV